MRTWASGNALGEEGNGQFGVAGKLAQFGDGDRIGSTGVGGRRGCFVGDRFVRFGSDRWRRVIRQGLIDWVIQRHGGVLHKR